MRSKTLGVITAGVVMAVCMAASVAHAHLIHIDVYTAKLTNPQSQAEWIETTLGLEAGSLTYLIKYEVEEGWEEDGALDSSYFDVDIDEEDFDGTVSWDLAGTDYVMAYLLVKSGKQQLNLYGVSNDQAVSSLGADEFDNGTERPPAVSHLSFFGLNKPGPEDPSGNVPDGGLTIALLGLGLAGLGLTRRFRAG